MAPRKKKNQPSSIDRLPEELRDQIAQLRRDGRTVTEIHDHMSKLDAGVSRSAVGRHVKGLAEIGEELRRAETMARFVVERFGDETDDRVGRANMRLLQGALMELITERPLDDDGQPVSLSAGEAKAISLSLQRLVSSQRVDADRQLKLRAEFAKEAGQKLDDAARSGEVDAEAVAKAKRIMGFET